MRHGEAVPAASSDFERTLSAYGQQQSAEVAKWLKRRLSCFEHGLVSPYKRAQQTFNQMRSLLPVGSVKVFDQLRPDGLASEVVAYLHELRHQRVGSTLIVSHLPLVAYLVTALCPSVPLLSFPTASIVLITLSPKGAGTYQWMQTVD